MDYKAKPKVGDVNKLASMLSKQKPAGVKDPKALAAVLGKKKLEKKI